MKITNIHLDDNAFPDEITAVITRDEAILLAQFTGNVTPTTLASHQIYEALVGDVFNRFWEDGVDGAARGDDR